MFCLWRLSFWIRMHQHLFISFPFHSCLSCSTERTCLLEFKLRTKEKEKGDCHLRYLCIKLDRKKYLFEFYFEDLHMRSTIELVFFFFVCLLFDKRSIDRSIDPVFFFFLHMMMIIIILSWVTNENNIEKRPSCVCVNECMQPFW